MPTVQSIATQLGLVSTIHRALSFHPVLENNQSMIWNIPVTYSNSMERSAGWFRANPNRISLHPGLIGPRATQQQHRATFLHELAHALQFMVYGRVDHSATWWEMMHQLGEKPVRCHNIAACRPASKQATRSIEEMGL